MRLQPVRVLTITSQKGGVGKTTVAINLAYSLARRGWRTLLVDTDPQGAVGLSLSRRARECRGFYDALEGRATAHEAVLETRLPELKIMPAGLCRDVPGTDAPASEAGVAMLFEALEPMGWDVVLVDTAAGPSTITRALLRASQYVLIPQQAEPLGMRSLPQVLRQVAECDAGTGELAVAGVLLTMTSRDQPEVAKVVRELRELMRRDVPATQEGSDASSAPSLLLRTEIERDEVFLKASAAGVPLALLYKNPPAAAVAFDQLAAELEERMELGPQEEQDDYTRLMD